MPNGGSVFLQWRQWYHYIGRGKKKPKKPKTGRTARQLKCANRVWSALCIPSSVCIPSGQPVWKSQSAATVIIDRRENDAVEQWLVVVPTVWLVASSALWLGGDVGSSYSDCMGCGHASSTFTKFSMRAGQSLWNGFADGKLCVAWLLCRLLKGVQARDAHTDTLI